MIHITLPDGSKREFPGPVTVAEVAASIGTGLAKAALAGKVRAAGEPSGAAKVVDTSFQMTADSALSIITAKDADGLEVIRHSTAHLLAYAVKELFPDAQVTIGPVIEHGFFYDFSYKRPFTPEDLVAIEKKMTELANKDERLCVACCRVMRRWNTSRVWASNTRQKSLPAFLRMKTFRCTVKASLRICAEAPTCPAPANSNISNS